MRKKIFIVLLTLTVLLFPTACGKLTTYTEITYDELKEKLENKDTFALVIGSSECHNCDAYKVTLNELITKHQIKVYYIDVIKMSEDVYKEFKSKMSFGGSTPTTVFITDGKEKTVYNRIIGALGYSKVEEKFEKAGYIKGTK